MSEQHTKGPWRIWDIGHGLHIEPNIAWIGFGTAHGQAEHKANARLIAAAPELLEALEAQEEAEKWIESADATDPFFEETCRLKLNHAADLRRAAIAKAKGGEA